MNREIRNALNSKAPKRVLSNIKPAKREGSDGEERIAKANGGVRLYRKELGQWWYTQFQQSDKSDSSSVGIATSTTLGSVIVGSGLSITGGGTLSLTSAGANYYLDGITKSSNTLTFSVNGATNQDYTFGSNAFNSTTIPTNTNQLTNGAGFLTAVATANIADEAVTLAKLAHVATDIFLGRTSNGTGDVEAMSVSDVTVLLNLDNYLTSISTLNADKLTAGTIPDARVSASAVTQHVASIVHDSLSGFVANEHLDWTSSVGTIHADNYTDTNTNQLTKFYFVDDDGDAVHPSHNHYIKFMNGSGITTNWNALDAEGTSQNPHILTITSTTSGTVTAVGTSGSITGGTITSTGTITHLTSAGHTHVPTTASQSGKFLKAVTDYGGSEAWATLTEADISDLGTYLTSSQAQSAYLPKSSPTLTADTTLSMNNARISARTSAGGGSDGLGTAGQVLHSHANGGGVYWATVSDDMQWILEDHSGDQVTVADGKYVKFIAGTGLGIDWTDTSNGAVDDEYDLTFTISGYNNSNWDTAYGWGNHASGGYLTGITGQAIGSLSNVDSSSPSNGQILKWSTDTWVVSDNTVTIGSINDITDVTITGTTDNYILMYENATGRWKNEPTTDITSVGTLTSLTTSGDLLVSSSDPTITIKRSNSSSYAGHLDFTNNADALGWQVGTNQVTGDGFEVNYGASNKFYLATDGNTTFRGRIKLDTQASSGSAGEIAHHSNNYLYMRGGTAGLAIGDDGLDRSIYFPNSGTIGVYGAIEFDSTATFAGEVTLSSTTGRINIGSRYRLYADNSNATAWIGVGSNLNNLKIGDADFGTPWATFASGGNATFAGTVTHTGNTALGGTYTGYACNIYGANEVLAMRSSHATDAAFSLRVNSSASSGGVSVLYIATKSSMLGSGTDTNPMIVAQGSRTLHLGFNTTSVLSLDSSSNAIFSGQVKCGDGSYLSNATSATTYVNHSGDVKLIGQQSNAVFGIDTWNGSGYTRRFTITGASTTATAQFQGDVVAYVSSDPVLKTNKELISNPLDKINSIGGYSFDWKESAEEYAPHLKGHDYGVMADEIADVLPELVQTREDGIRAVKYDKLVPLLIEGIKELKQQLDTLKGIA